MVKVGGEGFISEQWMLELAATESYEFQMNVTFIHTHTHTHTHGQNREQTAKGRTDRPAETDRKHTRYRHGYADRCRQELWKPGLCVRSAGPGVGGGFACAAAGRAIARAAAGFSLSLTQTALLHLLSRVLLALQKKSLRR